MSFRIEGIEVVTNEYELEMQPTSDGVPGEQCVNFGDSNSTYQSGAHKYICGPMTITSQNCTNASGATGRGLATIQPSQTSASDRQQGFMRDGDRAICHGVLCGSPLQKPGPCQCIVIVRTKGNGNALHSDAPKNHRKRGGPEEIIAVAYAPQENAWLGFTARELHDFTQEYLKLAHLVDLAYFADSQCDLETKKSAVKQLEKLVAKPGKTKGSEISELIWSKGGKSTYVQSDKIRNHWRKYALNDRAEKHGKLRDLKDWQRLKHQIRQKFTRRSLGSKALWSLPEEFEKVWLQHPAEFLKGDNYQVGGEMALLRLVANGSVGSSTFDLKERKLKLAAEGSVTISLTDASVQAELTIPRAEGWHWEYQRNGQSYDFGWIRLKTKGKASGYIGVSLLLSGELTAQAKSPKFSGGLSGEAFAGISGSLEGDLNLEWKSPGDDQKFQLLAAFEAKATVAGGIGAVAGLTFEWSARKLTIRASAKLVFGLGGGGGVAFMVDPRHLKTFLVCVGSNLLKADFHFIDMIETAAFEQISAWWAYAMAFGEEIDENLFDKAEAALDWWKDEQARQVNAESMAQRILANPAAYNMAVPEAKGRILCLLTQTFWLSREERQEEATLEFLKHNVRTRREFDKICECMTLQGGQRLAAHEGRQLLDNLFDLKDQIEFNDWLACLPENGQ